MTENKNYNYLFLQCKLVFTMSLVLRVHLYFMYYCNLLYNPLVWEAYVIIILEAANTWNVYLMPLSMKCRCVMTMLYNF